MGADFQGKCARLFESSLTQPLTGMDTTAEVKSRGHLLDQALHHISLEHVPLSAIMIATTADPLTATPPIVDTEILEEAVATSEIFRIAAIIYLFRVIHGDTVPLDGRTHEVLDKEPLYQALLTVGVSIVSTCA